MTDGVETVDSADVVQAARPAAAVDPAGSGDSGRSGDPDASERADVGFRRFVATRWRPLNRYAFLHTGDHQEAEDVVQAALERCWPKWERIAPGAREAYVRAAIANQAASRRRRKRLPRVPEDRLDTVAAAGDVAETQALRSGLWFALSELPPRQRTVVVLRVWEDRSEADTARILGISPGAVRSQLSKAIAKLRRHPQVREIAQVQMPESQHPESQHPESQHPESQHPESQHPESQHPESQIEESR